MTRGRGHYALHLNDQTRVDGIDLYVGTDELGHIPFDGSVYLATTPELGAALVAEGLGKPFPCARGWTMADISPLGVGGAVSLFRRNYDRLRPDRQLTPTSGAR